MNVDPWDIHLVLSVVQGINPTMGGTSSQVPVPRDIGQVG